MSARTVIALLTLALVACTEEEEGIVLCLEGQDQVHDVLVAFLESPGGPICRPWMGQGPFPLPECFAASPGDRYGHAMAVKVHWGNGCWSEFVVPFRKGRVVERHETIPGCDCLVDCGGCNCVGSCQVCSPEGPRVFDDALEVTDDACAP